MKSYNNAESGINKTVSNIVIGMENDGAIRHLAMEGLSVPEIKKRLLFPVSEKTIGEAIYKCFTDEGIFLEKEPGSGEAKDSYTFTEEYDSYGKPYFKRVLEKRTEDEKIEWREVRIDLKDSDLKSLKGRFASCSFGKIKYKDPELLEKMRELFTDDEFRTIIDIPFPLTDIYIRLFGVYESIISKLISSGLYEGTLYDAGSKTKYVLSQN